MSNGTGYAGDVSSNEAMATLTSDKNAVLIDVRTAAEWDNVGVPDLNSIEVTPVFIEWLSAPAMSPNQNFVAELSEELARRGATKQTPLLFLCRSGARSAAAARTMTSLGFDRCFNVAGGFEGAPGQGIEGWKHSDLPWKHP